MSDYGDTKFLAEVHAIPGSSAPGEIPPVVSAEVSHQEPSDDLLFLLTQHQAALVGFNALEDAWKGPYQDYTAALPPRPRALYWLTSDRFRPSGVERGPSGEGSRSYVYGEDDVAKLRARPATTIVEHHQPAPWDSGDTIVRRERVPDPVGESRRLDIIAAWDAWQTKREAVMESTGLNAANDAVEAASEAINAIEDAILATSPCTVEGLLAKARWIADKPRSDLYLDPLFRDLQAGVPPHVPQSLGADSELMAAIAEFRSADAMQAHLCRQYACDTDQIPDYAEVEAAWWAAIVQVANLPAQSWSAIVAKAEVLKMASGWDELERSESLGDSIAEDVLRLAGLSWDPKTTRCKLKNLSPSLSTMTTVIDRAA